MDNQVLGYKDLVVIFKDKVILDIEWFDFMIYEFYFIYFFLEYVELFCSCECLLLFKFIFFLLFLEVWVDSWLFGIIFQVLVFRIIGIFWISLFYFYYFEIFCLDFNIYKKFFIYKQREFVGGSFQIKYFIEDFIIELFKFFVVQFLDFNQLVKIEIDYWLCFLFLVVVEIEWRKWKVFWRGVEEEEEEEDDDFGEEMKVFRECQREEFSKVIFNLGKMILKEEMEKLLLI